jgi:NADH dehydrogenase FAD-containing subunit
LLLVVDPHLKNAAVYHVDAAAGTLTLKSTRDISYDLLVGDFNAQAPKPADLKKMLEASPGRR